MKCPVCKTEISKSTTICPNCKFDDLQHEFINAEDAMEWAKEMVLPYKRKWEAETAIDLSSEYSKEVLLRYFTDERHIYSIDELSINTKFAMFIITTKENGIPTNRVSVFGYEYFECDYTVNGDTVSIKMKNTDDSNEIHKACELSVPDANKKRELLNVLEIMKTKKFDFHFAFNDKMIWYNIKNNDNYYVVRNHFSGSHIQPMITKARYYVVDETDLQKPTKEYGTSILNLSVENDAGMPWGVNDQRVRADRIFKINIKQESTGSSVEQKYRAKHGETNDEIYYNEKKCSVYVGSEYQYEQFEFDNEILAHRFFDYMVNALSYMM